MRGPSQYIGEDIWLFAIRHWDVEDYCYLPKQHKLYQLQGIQYHVSAPKGDLWYNSRIYLGIWYTCVEVFLRHQHALALRLFMWTCLR